MNERPTLEAMAEQAKADYLRRSSVTFLECSINLMATHMTMDEVALILEEEARQIRELG